MGKLPVTCENRLCELLRVEVGDKDNVWDVFFKGDVLYKLENGEVWTIDGNGVRRNKSHEACIMNIKYSPTVVWWDGNITFGKSAHEWEKVLIPLKLMRKR